MPGKTPYHFRSGSISGTGYHTGDQKGSGRPDQWGRPLLFYKLSMEGQKSLNPALQVG